MYCTWRGVLHACFLSNRPAACLARRTLYSHHASAVLCSVIRISPRDSSCAASPQSDWSAVHSLRAASRRALSRLDTTRHATATAINEATGSAIASPSVRGGAREETGPGGAKRLRHEKKKVRQADKRARQARQRIGTHMRGLGRRRPPMTLMEHRRKGVGGTAGAASWTVT